MHPLQPDGAAIARARYRVRLFVRVVILTLFVLAAASALPQFLAMAQALIGGSSASASRTAGGFGMDMLDMYMMAGARSGAIPWSMVIEGDALFQAIVLAYSVPIAYSVLAVVLILYTRRIVNWLAPIPGLVCPQCSYELGHGSEHSRCPECGLTFASTPVSASTT